jgi:multidrug efflux pump subunit AcrA (membrane-fusion protein)
MDFFRKEALDHAAHGFPSPSTFHVATASLASWQGLSASVLATAIAVWSLVPLPEYVDAPAILDYTGVTEVGATVAGRVATLHANAGQDVTAGTPLVTLESDELARRIETARRGMNTFLFQGATAPPAEVPTIAERLLDVTEVAAALRIVAPATGSVSALHVRPGELVEPGVPVATIAPTGARLEFVVFAPPRVRDSLRPGDILTFTIEGVARRRLVATAQRISPGVVSAAAARKRINADARDLLNLPPGVIVIETRLDAASQDRLAASPWPGTTATSHIIVGRRTMLQRALSRP